MSLINKLLQDLEQREGAAVQQAPVIGEVRPVSAPSRSRTGVITGAAIAFVLAAGGAWLFTQRTPAVAAAPAAPVAAAVPVIRVAPVAPVAPEVPAVLAQTKPAPSVAALPSAPVKTVEPTAKAPVTIAAAAPAVAIEKFQAAKAKPEVVAVKPEAVVVTKPAAVVVKRDNPPPSPAAPETRPAPVVVVAVAPAVSAAPEPGPALQPAKPPRQQEAKIGDKISGADAGVPHKTVSPRQLSENLYKQALLLMQENKGNEARAALRKSLEAVPQNAAARQMLVSLQVETGNIADATALLRDGLKLTPEHSGFWMSLARLQLENADAAGALATLDQGAASAGDNAPYHAFQAALLQRGGRHDEAVKHYLAALNTDPSMPNWLIGVGISLQALGKHSDAAEAFQRAKNSGQLPEPMITFVDQRLRQLAQ